MPFKNEAQRRAMHANAPEVARRWEHKYGPPKDKSAPIKKALKRKMQEGRESKAKRPPNLRASDGHKSCQSCKHFSNSRCRLYGGYRVSPQQVSDSWEPRKQ